MRRLKISTALAIASLIALTGCNSGSDDGDKDDKDETSSASPTESETSDDMIPGDQVAAKAETALAGEVEKLAEGSFECPDLEREVGATATCTRSSEAEGYYLTIDGQVDVTDLRDDDFALHVQMDTTPQTFGTTGESIEADLSNQAQTKFGAAPSAIDCPDLEGVDGSTITCDLTVNDEEKKIEVTATEVDLAAFTMSYTFAEVTS
ncbi:DUF4333 domain-containing protein [Nocardioides jensenii]|uniref:DUF4333 domain-containing protein n=1 Tax=Nocardioides jensenii TaxID=1843 RepID=UPI00082BC4AA|nr:DUF4333 domain-containing protein [Nocardioides jensenii]